MTDTCETCRWAKLDADVPLGRLICAPHLPPILWRLAEAQKWHTPRNYFCALHTAKEDVSRG